MKAVNPISVRIPADLKQWLEERSIRNHRSMNAELVHMLSSLKRGAEAEAVFVAKPGHRRRYVSIEYKPWPAEGPKGPSVYVLTLWEEIEQSGVFKMAGLHEFHSHDECVSRSRTWGGSNVRIDDQTREAVVRDHPLQDEPAVTAKEMPNA